MLTRSRSRSGLRVCVLAAVTVSVVSLSSKACFLSAHILFSSSLISSSFISVCLSQHKLSIEPLLLTLHSHTPAHRP